MRSRILTALAVLVAAFLLVTDPVVADAARTITGKDIKNGSVTGKDIKDGSLQAADLSAAAVTQLRGNTGPTGPAGQTGPAGASAFAPPPAGTVVTGGGLLSVDVSGGTYLRSYSPLPVTTTRPLSDSSASRSVLFGASTFAAQSLVDAARCPGTFAAPTAAAGVLCVYVGATSNMEPTSGELYAGSGTGADGADSSGFYLAGLTQGAGAAVVRYTWAYTAG
ncbi:hypothetical protein [Nocardioides flavescens]|uniref:Collagen triple helix repeat-containing protein n=1 Tax=Nocardioides flavescens TaxID=2691959 RepID=A0A6L7EZ83_9ACTN|nr:hypothetical protein [Nocardioides flavescens]MXG88912.1 hypothetical protein [Nocardioides flavescens]